MTISIPYMYRDGDNYKSHGEIHLSAPLTAEQIARVRAALDGYLHFIPGPVSDDLLHLGTELADFPDDASDHCWHELDLDDITDHGEGGPSPIMTPDEFVESMERASAEGWNELYYLDSLGV